MGIAWTEDRIELLKRLWSNGKSASEIANQMGFVSRNAVIGKAHRLGLEGRLVGEKPGKSPLVRDARMPRKTVDPLKIAEIQKFMDRAPPPVIESIPAPVSLNMTLMDLTSKDCRWPVSGEKADTLFCGHDIADASVYCPYHYRMSRGRGTQSERNVDALLRRVAA